MNEKHVLIRCDVDAQLGTGHLRRCAVIAREIQNLGGDVRFVMRDPDGLGADLLSGMDPAIISLSPELTSESDAQHFADLCESLAVKTAVIDLYDPDPQFAVNLIRLGVRWLQFDRAAKRPILANWILNPNPQVFSGNYHGKTPRPETQLLLGPEYLPLRSEFAERKARQKFPLRAERGVIACGGGSDAGAIMFFLSALERVRTDIAWTALVGGKNPNLEQIKGYARDFHGYDLELRIDEVAVAEILADSDIGLITPGTLGFEAAAVGLPTIMVQIAENQRLVAEAWDKKGVGINLGPFTDLALQDLVSNVDRLANDRNARERMSSAGQALVDGRGGSRVARILMHDPLIDLHK